MTHLYGAGRPANTPPYVGRQLARELHNRLPDWLTQPSGLDAVDMVDPAGTWLLHICGDGSVDLERRGVPAGVLRCPDPGALCAYLAVYLVRAETRR